MATATAPAIACHTRFTRTCRGGPTPHPSSRPSRQTHTPRPHPVSPPLTVLMSRQARHAPRHPTLFAHRQSRPPTPAGLVHHEMAPTFVTLKGLATRPELNGALAKVLQWAEAPERVAVQLPAALGGESIRVKHSSFDAGVDEKADYWDEPAHARTSFTHEWSLCSHRGVPVDAPDVGDHLKGVPLASLFVDHAFPNLTSVVQHLEQKRGLEIVANRELVGNGADDYLDLAYEPSRYQGREYELVKINTMHVLSVGHLERLMTAGLQLIYDAQRAKGRRDYHHVFYENAKEGIVNTKVNFRYNGQDVWVTLLQHETATGGKPRLMLTTSG